MPTAPLPSDPSLEWLRNRARDVQRRDGVRLSDAQLSVAREYGFASWPKLRAHVELVRELSRAPEAAAPSDDAPTEFLRLACLAYGGDDGPERWATADAVLAAHPSLPSSSVHVAAAAADIDTVRAWLARDQRLASAPGGPHGWVPLLYLAYARISAAADEERVLACVHALLGAGADPNAGYLWHGLPSPFTVVTGALGEGEQGPLRQPRHPHDVAVARALLDAGADANDSQALYNRMFGADDSHLELLFAYGLGTGDGGPWRARLGHVVGSPPEQLRYQLAWATQRGTAARVRLLVEHGVDVQTPFADGTTPVERAARRGDADLVDILVAAGAHRPSLAPADALVAAVLGEDDDAAAGLLATDDGLVAAARAAHPWAVLEATTARRLRAVRRLVELGFDVNAAIPAGHGRVAGMTALHEAVSGDLALVRLLLELGADPDIRDAEFYATPLGWAEHGYAHEAAAVLRPVTAASEQTVDP